METEWVYGVWNGKQAEYIDGLANSGVGYFVLETDGKGSGLQVKAAFRRSTETPIPDNLVRITDPYAVQKLDTWRKERSGIRL